MDGALEDAAAIIDRLLMAQDMRAFERALILLVSVGRRDPNEIEALATERLETMPHEVQLFWKGRCDCKAHLN